MESLSWLERDRMQRQRAWEAAVRSHEAVVVQRRLSWPEYPSSRLEFQTLEEWRENEGARDQTVTDGSKMPSDTPLYWPPGRRPSGRSRRFG